MNCVNAGSAPLKPPGASAAGVSIKGLIIVKISFILLFKKRVVGNRAKKKSHLTFENHLEAFAATLC